MPRFRRFSRATVASALLVLTGCYTYAPVGTAPARGAHVRARLSTPQNVALTDLTVSNVVLLDAEVVRSGPDSLVVSALSLRSLSGGDFAAAGETVAIPRTSLEAVDARSFSWWRSAGLIVAAGTVTSLLFAALGTIDSGAGGGKPGPRPE
jgi:hypothetical protein